MCVVSATTIFSTAYGMTLACASDFSHIPFSLDLKYETKTKPHTRIIWHLDFVDLVVYSTQSYSNFLIQSYSTSSKHQVLRYYKSVQSLCQASTKVQQDPCTCFPVVRRQSKNIKFKTRNYLVNVFRVTAASMWLTREDSSSLNHSG